MRIVITGGAGFIGSHLANYLVNLKHDVLILDNFSSGTIDNIKSIINNVKIIKCDISKTGRWQNYFYKADWVFHLAAIADIVPSINYPKKYFDINVTGTLNILEAVRKFKVHKLLYAASSSCYGIPKKYPTKEDDEISPLYPYALTKYLGEELVINWGKIYKLNVNSLRLFNVYGTKSRTTNTYGAMFGVFLAQKLAGKKLTVVGNGSQMRDFIYVTHVVKAFVKTAESNLSGEVLNVGYGKPVTVNKIVSLIGGKKIHIPKRPGEPNVTHSSIKKIFKLLGWKPKIKIDEGVNFLLKEISFWKKAPIWTPKKIKIATSEWFKVLGK